MNITIKVASIIKNSKNEILLIKERYSKDSDYKWNLIKGTYDDYEEKIDETILREIKEEVGVAVNNLKLRRLYSYGNKENKRVLFIFQSEFIEDSEVVFSNSMGDESIIEFGWFSQDKLMSMQKDEFMADYVYKSFELIESDDGTVDFVNL